MAKREWNAAYLDKLAAQAKGAPGVYLDRRLAKFRAAHRVGGRSVALGTFATAEAASKAYRQAKAQIAAARAAEEPQPERVAFREVVERSARHWQGRGADGPEPVEGDALAFGGLRGEAAQVYLFRGVGFARIGGRSLPLWRWASRCPVCGADFETTTPARVAWMKGITRRCADHRSNKGRRPKREGSEGARNGQGGQAEGVAATLVADQVKKAATREILEALEKVRLAKALEEFGDLV